MKRKEFLGLLIGSMAISKLGFARTKIVEGPFSLPKLPYDYKALEPHIDAQTMEIHHSKHHQAYVNNLNDLVAKNNVTETNLEEIVKNISKYSYPIRNNAGGHWNHTFFWNIMTPKFVKPSDKVVELIKKSFGSFEKFTSDFTTAAQSRFGSGWAWLIVTDGKLKITSSSNQDNPLMDSFQEKGIPVLAIDVWEHAYYLKYQNKRADYIKAFWNVVNWEQVESHLKAAGL
ncbi:MAG: superoxide dismutase [Leadbetterella sp.]